jgi:hypothetical protein
MKYYVYVSPSKVDMLYSQIAAARPNAREATIGFDVKLLQGQIKQTRNAPEDSIGKISEVISQLRAHNLIGSIEDDRPYIEATLTMRWASYRGTFGQEVPPITFWGYSTFEYPFPGLVLALAGSRGNVIGAQADGSAHSHSGTEAMAKWFLENLEEPFTELPLELPPPLPGRFGYDGLSDDDIANCAWLAATQIRGPSAKYSFVAKVLHRSRWPNGFRSETDHIVLGSPIYVALAE